LQAQLRLVERGRVEQLAELLLAKQLAEQVAVKRERLARRSASGESPSYMKAAT